MDACGNDGTPCRCRTGILVNFYWEISIREFTGERYHPFSCILGTELEKKVNVS